MDCTHDKQFYRKLFFRELKHKNILPSFSLAFRFRSVTRVQWKTNFIEFEQEWCSVAQVILWRWHMQWNGIYSEVHLYADNSTIKLSTVRTINVTGAWQRVEQKCAITNTCFHVASLTSDTTASDYIFSLFRTFFLFPFCISGVLFSLSDDRSNMCAINA